MAVEERSFKDIIGSERRLSEIMDETKEWVTNAHYAGLTNVDSWLEGDMNYFLLYITGLIKYDLELYGDDLIRLAFPATSAGDFLDMIYARNGVFRKEGEYATTTVLFDLREELDFDAVIEAGTEVGTDEAITFHVTKDVTIPKGETSQYGFVQCNEIGTIGNVLAGTITNVFTDLSFDLTVINEYPLTDGVDRESDEDFKARARDLAFNNISVGTDLWVERVAKSLVDDAICYDVEPSVKLLVYKPKEGVSKQDLEELFERKEYRTRSTIIIQEAESVTVIDESKSIVLLLKNGYVSETVVNLISLSIKNYVDRKLKLGGLFKARCIKYLCESVEGVLYADITGFRDMELTNNQYAVIKGSLNITTEYES